MNLHNIVIAAAGNPIPDGSGVWSVNTASGAYTTGAPQIMYWSGQRVFVLTYSSMSSRLGYYAFSSTDCITWNTIELLYTYNNVGSGCTDMCVYKNLVLAYGYTSIAGSPLNIYRLSTDSGQTFGTYSFPIPYAFDNRYKQMGVRNGVFFILTEANIYYSSDCVNWAISPSYPDTTLFAGKSNVVNTAQYAYCISGYNVLRTPDGISWEHIGTCPLYPGSHSLNTPLFTARPLSLAWNGSILCVVDLYYGTVATSQDGGVTWTTNTNLSTAFSSQPPVYLWMPITSVIFNGLYFLATGVAGKIAASKDGINWTLSTQLTNNVQWGARNCASMVWNGEQIITLSVAVSPAEPFRVGITS